jgi:hypothetical protein
VVSGKKTFYDGFVKSQNKEKGHTELDSGQGPG